MIEIETIKEYELYLKKICKDRQGEEELTKLILKAFYDGIVFSQGRLKVDITGGKNENI